MPESAGSLLQLAAAEVAVVRGDETLERRGSFTEYLLYSRLYVGEQFSSGHRSD